MVPIDPELHEIIVRGILGFGFLGYVTWHYYAWGKKRGRWW